MMRRRISNFQRTAWAAIFALLVQALLPAIVHAGAAQGGTLAEICTAFGIKKADVSGKAGVDAGKKQCEVCALAQLAALPPSLAVFLPAEAIGFAFSPVPAGLPSSLAATPPARGPPATA